MYFLDAEQLAKIEQENAGGLPAKAIIGIFRACGVRLSEATFRKYVQVGLLPRSRRVGRKGKHRGSRGLYPANAVRRVNLIKKMMAEGLTLEEIGRSFVFYRNGIDELERVLDGVLAGHERELGTRPMPPEVRRHLEREVLAARRDGKRLVRQLERIASRFVVGAPPSDSQFDDVPARAAAGAR